VSFTPRPLYPPKKKSRYPSDGWVAAGLDSEGYKTNVLPLQRIESAVQLVTRTVSVLAKIGTMRHPPQIWNQDSSVAAVTWPRAGRRENYGSLSSPQRPDRL
jgi:hypothetical protein